LRENIQATTLSLTARDRDDIERVFAAPRARQALRVV
jgi:hypothetical protein